MNENKFYITIGLIYTIIISFDYMKFLGYNYIWTAFNGYLYISVTDTLLLISFFVIDKYLTDNKKLKKALNEAIHWKYYLLKKIMTLK